MAATHVDPTDRILDLRDLQALPRRSPVHDLAQQSRLSCTVQHVAFPADLGFPFPRWYFPPALLHISFRRLHLLQSVRFVSTNFLCIFILIGHWRRLLALVSLHRSVKLLLGMLDSS
jgi:hypothetical protein